MMVFDMRTIEVENVGVYENCLDDRGHEIEGLNGVELMDGHYCKHYRKARCFRDIIEEPGSLKKRLPQLQHFCGKSKRFLGFARCCILGCSGFEKGKSAGVKRIRNQIRREREKAGWVIDENGRVL